MAIFGEVNGEYGTQIFLRETVWLKPPALLNNTHFWLRFHRRNQIVLLEATSKKQQKNTRAGGEMAQTKQRKVALMGFRSVGKSSLAIQFVQVQAECR